ncbi:hypothetical protein JQ616_05395 [Bradyrhizobium tropiciagri]|uniref:hypothetical protein n=1 Tax=Bradyrhizobium tropiciagri TaxID=312253 RepID=UPI001BA71ECD|nr:hypothetical protein [Bradyrhizobium tropiciagri]MBR0894378.1 hypothetical protein [Bradyrhizobium tropiciagri]
MFEKLAKFRSFEPRRLPRPAASYSNDNLPGFRRPADRQRPTPACHWVLIDGRLECRWIVDATTESSVDDLNRQRRADRRSGPRATILRAVALKLTAS